MPRRLSLTELPPVNGDAGRVPADPFDRWWAHRRQAGRFDVRQVPFDQLDSWSFEESTGNLGHHSGRFFTIEGLQVSGPGVDTRCQPIINQPEIGILGILVKQIDGVMHCLMQAKMEPGNVNTLQLSPTVQATRSNYTQVHRGTTTRYLEYFAGPRRGQVLVDVLQSEQGAWFWRKRNRNMVVLATDEVEEHPDYRWVPLRQVRELLRVDNLVNMDARTVLSCMPFELDDEVPADSDAFTGALVRSHQYEPPGALHTAGRILSWFTDAKTHCDWTARLVPMAAVPGWTRTADEIVDDERRQFRIIAVRVEAGSREVTRWTQPLLAPQGQGLATFLVRPIHGVLHVLVRARPEAGLLDQVEMAPSIQLLPGEDATAIPEAVVRDLLDPDAGTVRFDAVLSEEGGRFYHALTRYRIVEVGAEVPVDLPASLCWMTVRQLMDLLRHGHYLNIEARSLLACLHGLR